MERLSETLVLETDTGFDTGKDVLVNADTETGMYSYPRILAFVSRPSVFFPRLRIPTPIRRLTRRHEPRIHAKRLGSYEEARNHAEKSVIMQRGRVMQRDEELQEIVQRGEGSCKEAINHVEKQESFREERNHAERRKITHRGVESCKEAKSHAKKTRNHAER